MCCRSGSELHFKDVHRKKGGGWMVHVWRRGLICLSDNGYEQSVRTAVTHTVSAVCSLIFDSRFQKDSSWLTRICSHFLQPSNFLFFSRCFKCGKKNGGWQGEAPWRRWQKRTVEEGKINKLYLNWVNVKEKSLYSTPTKHPFTVLWSLSNVKPPPAVKAY